MANVNENLRIVGFESLPEEMLRKICIGYSYAEMSRLRTVSVKMNRSIYLIFRSVLENAESVVKREIEIQSELMEKSPRQLFFAEISLFQNLKNLKISISLVLTAIRKFDGTTISPPLPGKVCITFKCNAQNGYLIEICTPFLQWLDLLLFCIAEYQSLYQDYIDSVRSCELGPFTTTRLLCESVDLQCIIRQYAVCHLYETTA
jgi:hypothetical protein